MKYVLKAGVLSSGSKKLAYLRGTFHSSERKVFFADGKLVLRTIVVKLETPKEREGDIRFKRYVMLDENEKERGFAKPDYAKEEDPAVVGWPFCRMPRVDHAQMFILGKEYNLVMKNSKSYSLIKETGEAVIQIFHRGLSGGWNIEAADGFLPEVICGVFAFCRYMEYENELLVV